MKLLMITILTLFAHNLLGQINMSDSTVQVVGYWAKNETQTYTFSLDKYKVKKDDTIQREIITYEVDITVKDSTANSYTIEWYYKNYHTNSENEIVKKLTAVSEDISVLIKTDEFGAFEEVLNWEEVRDYMKTSIEKITPDLKELPNFEQILGLIAATYSTKEAIEANAIKDVLQFYFYHGGSYKLQIMFKN